MGILTYDKQTNTRYCGNISVRNKILLLRFIRHKRIQEGIIGNGAYRAGCGKGCRQIFRIRIFYPAFAGHSVRTLCPAPCAAISLAFCMALCQAEWQGWRTEAGGRRNRSDGNEHKETEGETAEWNIR